MAKVIYETYFTENTRLQGWACPEQAIMKSQRQISEDLIYQEHLPYRVGAYLILSRKYIFLKSFKGYVTIYKRLKVYIPYPITSSKSCADDTKHGLIVNHINYNPACLPHCMRFNFPTAALIMPNNISHSSMV